MKHSGTADLPLHYGQVPKWLAQRMSLLGGAIVESLIIQYGRNEVLRRMSDPFWFQSLGCVMGMDWHSSGITTSVMGALKSAINPKAKELGLYICGGRGKHSRQTPNELMKIADDTGLDGHHLVHCSKLSAKVDNTAVQDGFQLYLHSFMLTVDGQWSVIQQGMNTESGMARRYHWHSEQLKSFVEEPHTFVLGKNLGLILNLTDKEAAQTRDGIVQVAQENPARSISEIQKLMMPRHHDVREKDVDIKRLGAILTIAQEKEVNDFESLLLLNGVGPRTLQSLTLVSEVIHGTPSRFSDPARFSFAHGGKDGHPFPVPLKVYDETIDVLRKSVEHAKLGITDKQEAIKNLSKAAQHAEQFFKPENRLNELIEKERNDSWKYGGRTVFGKAKPKQNQLSLF
ncbi:MAG TPA: DUF763 domain-containing protein [Chitinophagales bacterium]|nr:DUF763 domain-containing protein [Chitinophagales bacterium]